MRELQSSEAYLESGRGAHHYHLTDNGIAQGNIPRGDGGKYLEYDIMEEHYSCITQTSLPIEGRS